MEKVRSGPLTRPAQAATRTLESIPPLRNAPTGTSAIRWRPTASSSFSRIASAHSSTVGPRVRLEAEAPVPPRRSSPVPRPDRQDVRRRQLLDPPEDRPIPRHHAEGQVVLQRRRVDRAVDPRIRQDRLDLGAEQQFLAVPVDVQRLDPEPVPRQQEPPPRPVPQGDREHPPQPPHQVVAVLLVEVDDDLRVAVRPEPVPPRLQPCPQLPVIVDLPVEDDLDRPVLVADRLVPTGQVDDRRPALQVDDREPSGAPARRPVRTRPPSRPARDGPGAAIASRRPRSAGRSRSA